MSIRVMHKNTVLWEDSNLSSLPEALVTIAEGMPEGDVTDVSIFLDGQLHSLKTPLVLDAEKHPALSRLRITLAGEGGDNPSITSLISLDSRSFTHVGDNIYKCTLPKDENGKHPVFRTLYKGDRRVPLAASESSIHPFGFVNHYGGYPEDEYKEYGGGLYVPYEVAARLAAAKSIAATEMMMIIEWEFIIVHVMGVDLSDTVCHEEKLYAKVLIKEDHLYSMVRCTNPCIGIKNRAFYFANNAIYLTENTYAYDYRTGELFVRLADGERIEDVRFSYPALKNLLTLKSLTGMTIKGITFTGVDSFYVVENGYHSGQANNEKRAGKLTDAAVYTASLTDFTIKDCYFHDIGCNALVMKDRSEGVTIRDNRFARISMSAIAIGNTTVEWENPINRSLAIVIEDNYFQTIGYEYPSALAVYLTQVDGLLISHNTMDDCAYSAISVGWMMPEGRETTNIKNTEICFNRVTNYMGTLNDGAAYYVHGPNAPHNVEERFNSMHDNFCLRDSEKRGCHGYYLDGSSSNWEVFDNVTHGASLSLFMQYHVPSQYNWNNRAYAIYSTKPVTQENHAPDRNVHLGECYVDEGGLDALFESYPKAREIFENSGSRTYTKE